MRQTEEGDVGEVGREDIGSLMADLDEFVRDHRPHGPLTGDASEPTPHGCMVEISCSCGVVLMRWVTPGEAALESLRLTFGFIRPTVARWTAAASC